MAVSGRALAYVAGGFVLLYSGYANRSLKDTLTSFLAGHAPAASPTGAPSVGVATLDSSTSSSSASSSGGGAVASGGATGHTATANQAIARALAAPYGWSTGQNWTDLVSLWTRESGWSNTAENPSSQAYGIPQSLPWTKMPKSAWPASAGGSSNSTAQISWGLSYIKDTYGSPTAAWAHEESAGWY